MDDLLFDLLVPRHLRSETQRTLGQTEGGYH